MQVFLLVAAQLLLCYAIEEPSYRVTKHLGGNIELRQYEPYCVAEVRVTGTPNSAGSKAFPILAGYIFGKNKGERKMAMTAPVVEQAEPVKMAMTAPVVEMAEGSGYVVQFVLPKDITLQNAPEPLDARVQLRQVKPGLRACLRYSGFWSDSKTEQELNRLKAALEKEGLSWTGEPVWSRYDPPYTPWFLRRNEIWLEVKGK
eukprot:g74933.t1